MSASIRCISGDIDSAITFYTDLLGFRLENRRPPESATISKGHLRLLLCKPNSRGAEQVTPSRHNTAPDVQNRLHVEVDDLESIAEGLTSAGIQFDCNADGDNKHILLWDPCGNRVELFGFSAVTCSSNSRPFWPLLACPVCCGALVASAGGAACSACEEKFLSERGPPQLDLRLQAEKPYTKIFTLGGTKTLPNGIVVDELPPNCTPAIPNWSDVTIPLELIGGNRLTPELLSYFPCGNGSGTWMLDLGCGSGGLRGFFQQLTRLQYLGVDYMSKTADLLVDAHSLPFKDESFDLVLCLAVLEHLEIPDIACPKHCGF